MNSLWRPVLDWKYGQCYTFDPKLHEIAKVPMIATNSISKYLVQSFRFNVSRKIISFLLKILLKYFCFQFESLGQWYKEDTSIKIFLHENFNDFVFAKHKIGDEFELEKGQMKKYFMKKTVVKALPAKDKSCSNKQYFGKRACIEEKVSIEIILNHLNL